MKKRFTLMITALLLMITSFAWGQAREEVVAYTLDGTITGGTNGYATESEITQNGMTWMVTGNTTMSPWRIGGKNLEGVDRPLYSTSAMSDNITKVVVTNGSATATVNSMTLYVSSSADFSNATTVTGSFTASSTTTFARPASADWTNKYFKLVYNITAGGSNQYAQLVSAEFFKENGGQQIVATPTFSPAAGTYYEAQNVTISCTTADATIYYTTDGTTPVVEATGINGTQYTSPIAISETTTVKAIAIKNGMTNSNVATATYTIEDAPTVITIAAAKALAVNEYALVQGIVTFIDGRNVYVQDETAGIDLYLNSGTVPSGLALGDKVQAYGKRANYNGLLELSYINGNDASQFSIISTGNELPLAEKTIAEINSDGAGSNLLQSTRVKVVDAVIGTINTSSNTPLTQGENTINIYKVPALTDIEAGDNVDVIAVIGFYNNPQLRVAFASDVTIHETPVQTVATPTFTPEAGTYTEAQSVTIECTTDGATIYYTLDGNDPTSESNTYSDAIAISETTTVKAFAVRDGMNPSAIATAVYEIQQPTPPAQETSYTLITSNSDLVAGGKYIVVGIKSEAYKALGKQATNNRTAADVTPVNNVVTLTPATTNDGGVFELTLGQAGDYWTLYDAVNAGYLYAASSSSNYLKVQAENDANGQWAIDIAANGVATIMAQGTNTRNWLRLNNNGSPFSCYASGQLDVYLYKAGSSPTPPQPSYYTVNIATGITNGTVSANPTSAEEGTTITVTATPNTGYELTSLTYTYAGVATPIDIMEAKQFEMPAADVTVNATFEAEPIEPITIAEARALDNNEYAKVEGIVTFLEGRNVFIQDETGGINLYLNSNTVPSTIALGDMVMGYGKKTVYGGLVELTGINGSDQNQFAILSSGNELPLVVKTLEEIIADFNGDNALQATRVMVEDAVIGAINTSGNTTITQGDNSTIIYKIPAVTGLEEGDIVTVTSVIGAFNNVLQLRVALASDVTFTHPAGITVNPTTLSGFTYVYEEGPSTVKTFNISGRSLTAPTHIYAPENYEMSSFPGDNFYPESHITINTYTGVYNYTIKVRLKAGLEIGEYDEDITITQEEIGTMTVALSGNVTGEQPQPSGYTRVSDLSQVTSGSKVIFAARYNEVANEYYAMTATASGKPEGVLFTSVTDNGEVLPAAITDMEDTFYWTVDVNGDSYTFTNANGDVLGYTSSTNFSPGGDNTAWAITYQTSEATAMVPEYSAFVINNVNNELRAFAMNSNHNFGPYHTQNIASETYNFFIDMFVTDGGGTPVCAAPTFTPEAGTYYEGQTVEIACNTADATIYYTLDGSDPDENSEVYSEPIAVAESMTIKAIAMKEGYENSNIATADYIIIIGAVTIFEQDWEGDMNGWTFVTVEGSKPWTIGQYQGNHYANANGFNGGVNEQWCISPAFSLNVYSNASLSFRNAKNYTGPDMQVLFSNNYDGENPVTATWVELDYIMSTGSYTWAESGSIDLANFTGDECYIGFKYTSTETEAAAWEVDDIVLMGFTTDPYLTVTPNALSGFNYIVGNGPSAVQTFTVSGGNLPPAPGGTTGGITITCSNTHYEFSLDGEEFWPYTISIQATGTLEPTTVYVRLEAGLYVGQWDGVVTFEDGGLEVTATVSGTVIEEPVPGGDWNRIYALGDLHNGDQVILASRYDATVGDGYYAMTAGVSGKPDGVLFTSVNEGGVEKLPAEISDDADTYLWNVIMNGDVITLVNAAGDSLGYSSSTNFSGNVQTEWNIALQTSEEGALIPNYTGFVITNAETTNRGVAKNTSNKFGAYSTSNISNPDYNFFLDLFVYGGSVTPTVATPVFSMASGTYYEVIEVEITCTTEGATIYYTTDGSDPTAESDVYEEPIVVENDMTIKAMAMMEGYDDSGIATASYVIITDVIVLLNQDWEGEMNGWTFVTIEGNKPWTIGQYNGNHYANANGYNDDVDNEQWCISPAITIGFDLYKNITLTFMNATKFDGPALELYISNNYDGQDPTAASWQPLEYIQSEGNYTWTESGEILLDPYIFGLTCHIGFRYISTIDEGAAAWEIDDILITADYYWMTITPDSALNVDVWNNHNELMISNDSDESVNVVVYNLVGQPVLSQTVATGNNVIRHDLAEGIYIVRIANGKEMTGVKVVVRR